MRLLKTVLLFLVYKKNNYIYKIYRNTNAGWEDLKMSYFFKQF